MDPDGSDSNDGLSTKTAWRTIDHVNSTTFQPGDAVSFKGGATFPGNLVVTASGNQKNRITFNSFGRGQATITAGDGTAVLLQDTQFVTISNLSLVGSGVSTTGVTTNTGAGVIFLSTATSGPKLAGNVAEKLTISGLRSGILIEADSGVSPQTSWQGFDGLSVVDCDISFTGFAGIFSWARGPNPFPVLQSDSTAHSNVWISGNNVHDIFGMDNTTIFTETFGSGIRICNMNGGLIEFNRINNVGHMANIGNPTCFESEAGSDITWQFNEAANCRLPAGHNDGGGFDLDGNTQNFTVQYNWVHDNDGYGIGGGGVGGFGSGKNVGHVIRFNVFVNNCKTAAGVGGMGEIDFWGENDDMQFFNNTIWSNLDTQRVLFAIPSLVSGTMANNILVCPASRDIVSIVAPQYAPVFTNNLYWCPDGEPTFVSDNADITGLAGWQAAGFEMLDGVPVGLQADPQLVKPGPAPGELPARPVSALTDYDTKVSSPARGAGINPMLLGIQPGPLDFHANLLNLTSVDLGASQSTFRGQRGNS